MPAFSSGLLLGGLGGSMFAKLLGGGKKKPVPALGPQDTAVAAAAAATPGAVAKPSSPDVVGRLRKRKPGDPRISGGSLRQMTGTVGTAIGGATMGGRTY